MAAGDSDNLTNPFDSQDPTDAIYESLIGNYIRGMAITLSY